MKKKILRFAIRVVALLLGIVLATAFGWNFIIGLFSWDHNNHTPMLLHWGVSFISFIGYNALFHFVWETRRKKK